MKPTWLLALGALLLGGCVSRFHHGGALPSGAPLYQSAPGAPVTLSADEAGYAITTSAGLSYRAVWTGSTGANNDFRHFFGSIWTAGHFTSVDPGCGGHCALEASQDFVSAPVVAPGGERIDFDTLASDGLDGLDFTVDTEPVYFDLYFNGQHEPQLVNFADANQGGAQAVTDAAPFGLVTQ